MTSTDIMVSMSCQASIQVWAHDAQFVSESWDVLLVRYQLAQLIFYKCSAITFPFIGPKPTFTEKRC